MTGSIHPPIGMQLFLSSFIEDKDQVFEQKKISRPWRQSLICFKHLRRHAISLTDSAVYTGTEKNTAISQMTVLCIYTEISPNIGIDKKLHCFLYCCHWLPIICIVSQPSDSGETVAETFMKYWVYRSIAVPRDTTDRSRLFIFHSFFIWVRPQRSIEKNYYYYYYIISRNLFIYF